MIDLIRFAACAALAFLHVCVGAPFDPREEVDRPPEPHCPGVTGDATQLGIAIPSRSLKNVYWLGVHDSNR